MRLIESLAVKAAEAHKQDIKKHIDKLRAEQKSNEIGQYNRSLRNQELMEFRKQTLDQQEELAFAEARRYLKDKKERI